MSAASLTHKEHITSRPGVCGGKPCVAGTRIRVWDVAVLAQSGHSPDEILTAYPHLTLADVHAALAYYYDNQQTLDRQNADDEQFAEQCRQTLGPGPLERKLAESRNLPKP